jgi:hypothetical protein
MPTVEGIDNDMQPKGYGVLAETNSGDAVVAASTDGIGVTAGSNTQPGVIGTSNTAAGVIGNSTSGAGVEGVSGGGAPDRVSTFAPGVLGRSGGGAGVEGYSDTDYGVRGETNSGRAGVAGVSKSGNGVFAYSTSRTKYALEANSTTGLTALLQGNVKIEGNLEITGTLNKDGGRFKIDHPLDPANKYLSHSFVESPDMKNIYDGVVTLDDKGEAEIELPDWFDALNKDFRYQLTAIGAPGPNLHISEEISSDGVATTTSYSNSRSSNSNKNNGSSRFKIAGGISGMKVSWQVTGIRKDPWANAHRIPVEEDKPAKERGYYTYPELFMVSSQKRKE